MHDSHGTENHERNLNAIIRRTAWAVCIVVLIIGSELGAGVPTAPLSLERVVPESPGSKVLPGAEIQAEQTGWYAPRLMDAISIVPEVYDSEGRPAKKNSRLSPRSMAAGHLNNDGAVDLVVGYSSEDGARLRVLMGNPAIRRSRAVRTAMETVHGRQISPFQESAFEMAVPEAPDLLAVGDFNADGAMDVVSASPGSGRLFLFAGDGGGHLASAEIHDLPGEITAMAAGSVNHRDGLEDLVVALSGPDGDFAFVYESPEGALGARPEIHTLPAPATSASIGFAVQAGRGDIALACGNEVVLIVGRNRRLHHPAEIQEQVGVAQLIRLDTGSKIAAVTLADLAGDRLDEIVVVGIDDCLQHASIENDRRPVFKNAGWIDRRSGEGAVATLCPTRMSGSRHQQLVALRDGGLMATVVDIRETSEKAASAATVTNDDGITAVLPLRLDRDAIADLVLISVDSEDPAVLMNTTRDTFVVTSTDNSNDGTCSPYPGHCSLREAIQAANNNPLYDAIEFHPSGVHFNAIGATSTMPTITQAVLIDGEQVDWPLVWKTAVDGTGNSAYFLKVTGGSSTVTDLIVFNVGGEAVRVRDGDGNVISGNWIGLDVTGAAAGNSGAGLSIEGGSSDNVVGGTTSSERNTLSANRYNLKIYQAPSDDPATNNKIKGNFIGTNTSGTDARGGDFGVFIGGASGNWVGVALYGNVISGNRLNGIRIFSGDDLPECANTVVFGNKIGTNTTGDLAVGNNDWAVRLLESTDTVIGGTTPTLRNVISGNDEFGILDEDSTGTEIIGNYIGVDASGTAALGNGDSGVRFGNTATATPTQNCVVGGIASGAENVISANPAGIEVRSGASDIFIRSNLIGTAVDGTTPLGNGTGVWIEGAGANISIGGDGAGNVIGGSAGSGVAVDFTDGVEIKGNWIGTATGGTTNLGNGGSGILIRGATTNAMIGGSIPGGNLIKWNETGISLRHSATSSGNTILSNAIHANLGLAIDLGEDGVTANDLGDGDSGVNGLQNYPDLISAVVTGDDQVVVEGILQSETLSDFTLEFFANSGCDPSGYGEADHLISSHQVTTNSGGGAPFSYPMAVPLDFYDSISATATRIVAGAGDETSEVSLCIQITGAAAPEIFSDDFETGNLNAWSAIVP